MAEQAKAEINKIENLANKINQWIKEGVFGHIVAIAKENERMGYLVALNHLRAKNREAVFDKKFGIDTLTYSGGELNDIPEEEVIHANKIADRLNRKHGYNNALNLFYE